MQEQGTQEQAKVLDMSKDINTELANNELVLAMQDLCVNFPVASNWLGKPIQFAHALNGISLEIKRGEAFGIVGESGCGKSTLASVLMDLLPPTSGTYQRMPRADGSPANIQIVFQDPQSSLDPRLSAWRVIVEPVVVRQAKSGNNQAKLDNKQLRQLANDLAIKVGLRAEHMDRYVHEFSGGQRQRIAIARALSSNPDVMLLDEPTSALDISVQAQILNLLQELRDEFGLTYVLISHNVSVIRHLCDRVAVMYLGQVVEQGPAHDVLNKPQHPYTQELLDAVPRLDKVWDGEHIAPKELPSNRNLPTGCYFIDRCPWATEGCELVQNLQADPGNNEHLIRCHVAIKKLNG